MLLSAVIATSSRRGGRPGKPIEVEQRWAVPAFCGSGFSRDALDQRHRD
jgi:hypothetical protein